MKKIALIAAATVSLFAIVGCAKDGELDVTSGVGISVTRSGCPSVAVPDGTGDITLFNPNSSQESSAIDIVATLTKVRPTCNSAAEKIYSVASFEVQARRTNTSGARTVTLPYFTSVVQGSSAVISKRIGAVTLEFADGQAKASGAGQAASYIDASAARLPTDIVEKITKKRKAGDIDAALDPLADPAVRAAVIRSSFEMLVGFQLTEDQLRYNVTR